MHFERFEFDRARREFLDARIGDEVFSGAHVDWKGCMRSDRAWIFEQLDEILAAWTVAEPGAELPPRWLLVGTASPDAPDDVRYTLYQGGEAEGDWSACGSWESLRPQARELVLERAGEVLAALNGLLLIYD